MEIEKYRFAIGLLGEAIKDLGEQGWWTEKKADGIIPIEELKTLYVYLKD